MIVGIVLAIGRWQRHPAVSVLLVSSLATMLLCWLALRIDLPVIVCLGIRIWMAAARWQQHPAVSHLALWAGYSIRGGPLGCVRRNVEIVGFGRSSLVVEALRAAYSSDTRLHISRRFPMSAIPSLLSVEIEVHPGEKLALPPSIVGSIGPGVWRITVEPVESETAAPIRDHSAFLSGYADEDEGLYDDFAAR